MSGLMKGAAEIKGRPAIVDVPVGDGRILLFATNPCYRWQNHGEFAMLFNAILHFNDLRQTEKAGTTSSTTSMDELPELHELH
jgi:hypothetical protein